MEFADKLKRGESKLTFLEKMILLFFFLFYFIWSISKPFNYAPDEYMRYNVTRFLYDNNRLPVGTETIETQYGWGFSYAHYPTVLCNILAYLPMKVVGMLSDDEFYLVCAARFVSVLCGTITLYFVIKSCKLVSDSVIRWIPIFLVGTMPQFCFLSSYINNDIVAVAGSAIILYSWIVILKGKLNFYIAIMLAIGISVCALSYYNSYTWILCSGFLLIMIFMNLPSNRHKSFLKFVLIVFCTVLTLISYSFLRHIVLYKDLLGFSTVNYYRELYGTEFLRPSSFGTPFNSGISLYDMLFTMQWIKTSYGSFIECFGYMSVWGTKYIYYLYSAFFLIGVLGFLYSVHRFFVVSFTSKKFIEIVKYKIFGFWFNIVIVILIPIFLSIFYSYFMAFQPQGRYLYPAFIGIVAIISKGYHTILSCFEDKEQHFLVGMIIGMLLLIVISEFFVTYLG